MHITTLKAYHVIKSLVGDRYWNAESKQFNSFEGCTKFETVVLATIELRTRASYSEPSHLINVTDFTDIDNLLN